QGRPPGRDPRREGSRLRHRLAVHQLQALVALGAGSTGRFRGSQEVGMDTERLTARAAEIADRETKSLTDRTGASAAMHERAVKSLPAGVASNFQANDPYPVYLKRGHGSHVWDVDGNDYVDFHGGFGVNVVG